MKNFDSAYNDLPKIEIHSHLEASIRTLIDLATCNRYAYEASFIPDLVKSRLWQKYFAPAPGPTA